MDQKMPASVTMDIPGMEQRFAMVNTDTRDPHIYYSLFTALCVAAIGSVHYFRNPLLFVSMIEFN